MNRSVFLPRRPGQNWRLGLLFSACLTAFAPATVVVTKLENHDPSTNGPAVNAGTQLAVSSTDLINTGSASLSTVVSAGFSPYTGPTGSGTSTPTVLNDGSGGGWNITASNTAVTTQLTPWTITYTLNTATATAGYTLTGIDVMSLWTNDFVSQHYTIEIATVSNPAFAVLSGPSGDITADTSTAPGLNVGSSLQSQVRDTTGTLATGVTSIRFTFSTEANPSGSQILAAYREVDVFGSPTPIPEPAAASLALLTAGVCVLRRRRMA